MIEKDKEAIFKLLKDIRERLPRLARKANRYYTPKLITIFELMQTPTLQEGTQEFCALLNKARMLIQIENYGNQNLNITKRALAHYEVICTFL